MVSHSSLLPVRPGGQVWAVKERLRGAGKRTRVGGGILGGSGTCDVRHDVRRARPPAPPATLAAAPRSPTAGQWCDTRNLTTVDTASGTRSPAAEARMHR